MLATPNVTAFSEHSKPSSTGTDRWWRWTTIYGLLATIKVLNFGKDNWSHNLIFIAGIVLDFWGALEMVSTTDDRSLRLSTDCGLHEEKE